MEEIFANDVTNKGLISKIQTGHTAQYQRNNQPNEKMSRRPEQTFLQEDIQMANRHVRRCSATLIVREMQINTARYHLTLVRMATIKKSTNNKCLRGGREKGTLLHGLWECKFVDSMENGTEVP